MAFAGKLGGLLRQGLVKNAASGASAPMMHLLNSARLMSTKLFVGGLSWGTDDQSLREAFTSFGDVVEARVITDRDTGRSRGFGFVDFETDESASNALSMDGKELHGRNIRVNYANDKPSGGFRGGYGGGGGGGGYNNGSYGGGGGGGYNNSSYGSGGQDNF